MVQCKRGEIYYADLSPTIGSEQGGVRPVMIIQNNTGNRYAPTVIIAPITSRLSSKVKLPAHVRLGQIPWLDRDSIVLLGLVRYFIGTQSFSFEKEVRHGRDKANGCKGLLCRRCSEDTWSWTKQCLPLFR